MKALMFMLITAVGAMLLSAYIIIATILAIQFDRNCGGYIKRAADSNTIEMAIAELSVAVKYMEDKDLTKGYTSVLYTTPDEDVGFWYKNVNTTLAELKQLQADELSGKCILSPVDKSNQLIKVRETLLDNGENGVGITCPTGISRFPFNMALAALLTFSLIICLIGGVGLMANGIRRLMR
jgi:hypothetical protein